MRPLTSEATSTLVCGCNLPARRDVRREIALLHLLEANIDRLVAAFEGRQREAAGQHVPRPLPR